MLDCQTMGRLLHPYLDGELSAREALDIKSHDPVQVVRWFEKRINFPISLGQETVKNLRLRGGRLVGFQGKNAVFLAYEMGQYRLSLLMTTAEGVNLSAAEGFNLEQTRFY